MNANRTLIWNVAHIRQISNNLSRNLKTRNHHGINILGNKNMWRLSTNYSGHLKMRKIENPREIRHEAGIRRDVWSAGFFFKDRMRRRRYRKDFLKGKWHRFERICYKMLSCGKDAVLEGLLASLRKSQDSVSLERAIYCWNRGANFRRYVRNNSNNSEFTWELYNEMNTKPNFWILPSFKVNEL